MKFTKGKIDRIGNEIREGKDSISESTLRELQAYRTSHESSISQIFNTLCKLSFQVRKDSIVTFRIKRIESIIGKLDRYPSMRFSRMWDIGGCRCILKNDFQVYKLKKEIEKHFVVKENIKDYIENPKEDGYKSLHLFISLQNDDKIIEVQLRNQIDHNWSTLVEISDLLFDTRLKEYGDNKEFLKFHFLLSKVGSIGIREKRIIADTLKKHAYFDELSNVFTRNYLRVRKQWLEIENKKSSKFFLIIASKNEVPKISSFSTFEAAEEEYFQVYKSIHNANIVLTHLQSPNFNQINIAYSNYILTFHTFLDDSFKIIESLIIDSLKRRRIFHFVKYYGLYNSILLNHIRNLISEMEAAKKLSIEKFNNVSHRRKRKNKKPNISKDWASDIRKQISKNRDRTNKLEKELNTNLSKIIIERFLIIQTLKFVNNKYNKKLKKVLATTANHIT